MLYFIFQTKLFVAIYFFLYYSFKHARFKNAAPQVVFCENNESFSSHSLMYITSFLFEGIFCSHICIKFCSCMPL